MAWILDLPMLWFYLIQEIIYSIIGGVILFSVLSRYRKKKNNLSKIVFTAILCLVLTFAFSILQHASYITAMNLGVFQYLPFFLLLIGSYYWFIFSRIVFLGEHEHTKIEKIVFVMAIIAGIFGILRYYAPFWFGETNPINQVLFFARFVWLLSFEGLINAIILVGVIQMKSRIPKKDPFQSKITDIIITAIAYLIVTVLYLVDTLILIMTNV